MEIENVAGIGFTPGGTFEQQGKFTIGNSLFGKIIVNDQYRAAFIHEVFTHGSTGIGSQIQHRSGFGSGSGNDDGVVHGAVFFQFGNNRRYGGSFLTYGNVDAGNPLTFLVDDGIDGNGGFTGLSVTDDKFTLAAANGNHGVNSFQTGLHRFKNGFTSNNAGSEEFNGTIFCGFDFTFTVEGLTKCVDNTADHGFPNGNFHNSAGSLYLVAFLNIGVGPKNNATDVIFFQVHDHTHDTVGKLQEFVIHGIFEAINTRNTVTDGDNSTDFGYFHRGFIIFDLLL